MKKQITLFTIIMFWPIFTFSQLQGQKRIDSLHTVLKSQKEIASKVSTLEKLYETASYLDSEKGKQYALEIISLSEGDSYPLGMIIGNFSLGGYYFTIRKMDSATLHFQKTLDLASQHDLKDNVAGALSNLSIIEGDKGNYRNAIRLMDSVTQISWDNKDFLRYGVSLNTNGNNYYELGQYLNAMNSFKKALEVLDTIDREVYRRGDVYRNIGKLNYQQKDFNQAIENFTNAYEIYREVSDNQYSAHVLNDIGNVYIYFKDYYKAIEYFNESFEISQEFNFPEAAANALFNIGYAQRENGNYQEALNYFTKAGEINTYDQSSLNYVLELYHVGLTYSLLGNNKRAIEYLDKSVRLADSLKISNELKHALGYRSKAYVNAGNYKSAFEDYVASQKIKDSLFSIEKTKAIEELETIYETEKKEEEINTLNEKAKVDKLTKGLYAGGMASALAFSGLLVFGFRQRIKKNKIAREKQEEIYKQEIEHKKKELTSQTLHLVQKNTFIQELKENLESLKNSPEKFKMEFRRIVMLLKKQNASDKDWEVFKSYFSEVHNDFDQKLKTLYPDISEKEIRLAAFLRMNLTTKEIAATLNVLPDSILKSKYRLKKKLELDKEMDLSSFLNTL
ncbi:tetratricopeptide repeat protein [Flagellimonas flava]|uniref:Tetratricopeptide repeat-containing protein n=1 Tax=Flagellimonas flava TaxID=570519 RepID=A0A1M5IKR3_9FLAO|nr:tetratricopeptide repeat protein [Allomuricauda flava]SHG28836.1 Tetratricopeptide repeat-containing protein [Allomuricauda flava]